MISDLLRNYSYLEFALLNILSIFLGFLIRSTLAYIKQKWVTTFHQTLTYLLLPSITSIITTLISSNIALSLGMIGALSIVRFRTPVKSPLELVMFFALITIGIGVAVNFKLSLLLTFVIILTLLFFFQIQKIYIKKNKSFFNSSYDEGSIKHIMEVKSKSQIDFLNSNKNLENYYFNKEENFYNYRLLFDDKNTLNLLKDKLNTNSNIQSIDVKYVL